MQILFLSVGNNYLVKVRSGAAAVGACVPWVYQYSWQKKKKSSKTWVIHECLLSNACVALLSLLEFMFLLCLFIIKMEKLFCMFFYTKSLWICGNFVKKKKLNTKKKRKVLSFLLLLFLDGFMLKGSSLMEGIWLDGMAWFTPVFYSDLQAKLRTLVYSSYTSKKNNAGEVLNIVHLPANRKEACSSCSTQLKSQDCFQK